jgi:hypothetical protein
VNTGLLKGRCIKTQFLLIWETKIMKYLNGLVWGGKERGAFGTEYLTAHPRSSSKTGNIELLIILNK